jgi:PAS domain S-box-containing protein
MRGRRTEMQELRERAERRLSVDPVTPRLPDDRRALVYELQLHQVELQMQNDALREAQLELASSRARYRALYDFAPLAYVSIGADTRIAEANRAAAVLLGAGALHDLLGQRFSRFLAAEHSERFEHHRRELYAQRRPCSCELTLLVNGRRLAVRLQSAWLEGGIAAQWLLALIDLSADGVRSSSVQESSLRPATELGRAIGTALVVEDDRLVRAAIRRYLQLIGCEVYEVERGHDALELLRGDGGGGLRLLLSDVTLPDVSASELVVAARRLRPELLVLLVSPYAPSHSAHLAGLQLGAAVLGKPFGVDELQTALQRLLDA